MEAEPYSGPEPPPGTPESPPGPPGPPEPPPAGAGGDLVVVLVVLGVALVVLEVVLVVLVVLQSGFPSYLHPCKPRTGWEHSSFKKTASKEERTSDRVMLDATTLNKPAHLVVPARVGLANWLICNIQVF